MRGIITFIFKHSYYKKITYHYNVIINKYNLAFKIWLENIGKKFNTFSKKEIAYRDYNKILALQKWIDETNDLKQIFELKVIEIYLGHSSRKLNYNDYEKIHNKEKELCKIRDNRCTANRYIANNPTAIRLFLGHRYVKKCNNDYVSIILNTEKIADIDKIYQNTKDIIRNNISAVKIILGHTFDKNCFEDYRIIGSYKDEVKNIQDVIDHSSDYKNAWNLFSKGRNIDEIPLAEFLPIKREYFEKKEVFLQHYKNNKIQTLLIIGKKDYDYTCFTEEAYETDRRVYYYFTDFIPTLREWEKEDFLGVYGYYKKQMEEDNNRVRTFNNKARTFNRPVHENTYDLRIKDKSSMIKVVLDTPFRSYDMNASGINHFTTHELYLIRREAEKQKLNLTDIAENLCLYYNGLSKYKELCFINIDDLLASVKKGRKAYRCMEEYKFELSKREQAKRIINLYTKGYDYYFSNTDIETCSMLTINNIIENEEIIKSKDNELYEKERELYEKERELYWEEQKKKEIQEKENEAKRLKNFTSRWPSLPMEFKYNYLLTYYPTTCPFEATESEWDDRRIVWNFKNDPNRHIQAREHDYAVNYVIKELNGLLSKTFSSTDLSKLTLVCIPASTQEKTESRYKEFCKKMCDVTGMINSYDKIEVIKSKIEKRNGGTNFDYDNLWFNKSFFKDKYIILFDDVVSSGNSMLLFKLKLEEMGAYVIAGLSIGRTKHERYGNYI